MAKSFNFSQTPMRSSNGFSAVASTAVTASTPAKVSSFNTPKNKVSNVFSPISLRSPLADFSFRLAMAHTAKNPFRIN